MVMVGSKFEGHFVKLIAPLRRWPVANRQSRGVYWHYELSRLLGREHLGAGVTLLIPQKSIVIVCVTLHKMSPQLAAHGLQPSSASGQ